MMNLEAVAGEMVHLDADAFFASVEQAADARLRGMPMAVGGRRRGIIASASYEARARGIYTAMPTARALQVCPELTVVPGRYDLYEQFSEQVFGLCEEVTPLVERSSIDEGYLSLAGWRGGLEPEDRWRVEERGPGGAGVRARMEEVVERVRRLDAEITAWLKITVSTGIAGNKLVAQVASKLRKPHGFVVVPPGAEERFLAPLPARRLPGIGEKTGALLEAAGVVTIGDLARLGADGLRPFFGRRTAGVLEQARGVDGSPLRLERAAARSHGRQETFGQDTGDREAVARTVLGMIDGLLADLRAERQQARTMTLKIRYNDMEEASLQRSLEEPSDLEESFYPLVRPMLGRLWSRRVHLRLVGVTFSQFYDGWVQGDLFDDRRTRRKALALAADAWNATSAGKRSPLRRAVQVDPLE